MVLNKLHSIFVPVTSIEKSRQFYTDILGLQDYYSDEHMSFLKLDENDFTPELLLHHQTQVYNTSNQIILNFEYTELENFIK